MEILILQVFVSLVLVGGSLLLFGFTCRQRDFDHADRLSLLPLDDEPKEGQAQSTQLREECAAAHGLPARQRHSADFSTSPTRLHWARSCFDPHEREHRDEPHPPKTRSD
jgi:hypothetical protein